MHPSLLSVKWRYVCGCVVKRLQQMNEKLVFINLAKSLGCFLNASFVVSFYRVSSTAVLLASISPIQARAVPEFYKKKNLEHIPYELLYVIQTNKCIDLLAPEISENKRKDIQSELLQATGFEEDAYQAALKHPYLRLELGAYQGFNKQEGKDYCNPARQIIDLTNKSGVNNEQSNARTRTREEWIKENPELVHIWYNYTCFIEHKVPPVVRHAFIDALLKDYKKKWSELEAASKDIEFVKLVAGYRTVKAKKGDKCNTARNIYEVFKDKSVEEQRKIVGTHSSGNSEDLRAVSEANSGDRHETCKDAKDYLGCMNYKKNATNSSPKSSVNPSKDYCPDDADGWCIAGEGRDRFNMRKMKGWEYKEFTDGDVLYIDPIARRVPHKGQPSRYIAQRQVFRYYSEPTAATPGSYSTIGSASTNCTDYGSMINCTTTPPAQIYSPGIPGSAGGVKSIERTKVVDCVDGTSSLYIGNKAGKWKPVNKNSALFSYCDKRTTLPSLEMKL